MKLQAFEKINQIKMLKIYFVIYKNSSRIWTEKLVPLYLEHNGAEWG